MSDDKQRRTAGRRFLRTFALAVAFVAITVASVNRYAFRYMLRDENQAIVQLLSGWGRLYKPVLYDEISPAVAAFGASWARDAWDPIETGRLLNKKVFNHGVSGGTVYETRRFAESAMVNPNLEVAIINLNTIFRDWDVRAKYGFDEALLNVDANQEPNRWVGLQRAYSLALTGWALGTNLELISAIRVRDGGADQSEYLPSYHRVDFTERVEQIQTARERIFPAASSAPRETPRVPLSLFQKGAMAEFEIMIDGLCENGVDTIAYFTPKHVWENACDANATLELATLDFLRGKQAGCDASISYYNFNFPNPLTLEGVMSPVVDSRYYRPDGHPRPTVGLLMAARMFGKNLPTDAPPGLEEDFGVDLLAHEDPEAWIRDMARRCAGDWGDSGHPEQIPPR